jgi:hypothetical protein
MAFTTTPYMTLADVKNAIRGLSSNEDDGHITLLIPRVQAVIDAYTGYPFQTDGTQGTPSSRLFNGTDGCHLIVEPCQLITQVLEIGQNITAGYGEPFVLTSTTNDITADVVLLPNNVIPQYMVQRITGSPFYEGLANYQIKGVWGYPSVPADVTLAATWLAAHYYGLRDSFYADTLTQGTQTMRYSKQIPVHVREILDRYRANYFTAGDNR